MSVIKLALTAATVAMSVARNPMVRAGIRAAPLVLNERTRAAAAEGARTTAYNAGRLVRAVMPRKP